MVAKRTGVTGRAVIEIGKRALVESDKKCNRSSGREEPVNRETRVVEGGGGGGRRRWETAERAIPVPVENAVQSERVARAVESSPQND